MTRKFLPAAALSTLALAAAPAASQAENVVGLQTGGTSLALFTTAAPGTATTVPVTGLAAGDTLDSIAFRPANGLLYGTTASRHLYTINIAASPAVATQVKPDATFTTDTTTGDAGAGFNPVADRLRYVVDNTSLLTPMKLNFAIDADAVTAAKQTNLKAATGTTETRISGIGYSNLFAGATSTVEYGIDTGPGPAPQLVTINPPADGVVTPVGPVGSPSLPGFADIEFSPATNVPYVLLGQGAPTLNSIDLTKGTVSGAAAIGSSPLTELAIVPNGLLSTSAITTGEDQRFVPVTVTRARGSVGTVSVTFTTTDGTAKAGTDFIGGTGTVTFAPGETSKVLAFPIGDDGKIAGDKSFSVTLSGPTGGAVLDGGNATAVVTLTDSGKTTGTAPPAGGVTGSATPVTPVKLGAKPSVAFGTTRKLALKTLRTSGKRRVTFTCTSYCRADGTIKLGTVAVGKGTKTLLKAAGGSSYVDVKLTTLGKTRLGSKKARKVTVTLKVTDTANQVTSRTATLSLTVPKAAKKKTPAKKKS